MFYVAYFRDGAPSASRPVTFLFNGGPGSSTVWLHMGAFGPVRVETADGRHTPAAPYRVVSNDQSLLDAAARGDLRDNAKLAAQVDRMIASPRFEQGVRSFFSDMFGFEQFEGLTKDQAIYPKFSAALAKDAKEQMLRTVVDLLLTNKGDYRDIFTTRKTFLNRNLAALYKVPVEAGGVEGWVPYTFGPGEKRAGVLSLAGFLMLDPTHEGRSSPTIRGKTVRELFLCEPVPVPPPNVNFAAVQDTGDLVHRTARSRPGFIA